MTKRDASRIIFGVLSLLAFIAGAGGAALGPAPESGQAAPISLEADLTIGIEDRDESLMFGNVSRVGLDGRGNIYVLDYKFRKIAVFDEAGRVQTPRFCGQASRAGDLLLYFLGVRPFLTS